MYDDRKSNRHSETKQKQTFYILKLEENLKLLYKVYYKVISKYF